jgi:predicted porin
MKKISLVLSIAAASSLMAANVELYGVAHVSVDSVDNGTKSTSTVASNSSRIGIKGSQAIDGGMTIVGQFEVGADLSGAGKDDGNGGDFTGSKGLFTRVRDSYVGIAGNFGTVAAGRLGAQNQWIYDYNLFGDQVGDLGNILGAGGVGPDRAEHTIAYITPTFSGLNAVLAYMTPDGNNNPTAFVGKINYDSGMGIKAGLGYIGVDVKDPNKDNPSELALSLSYSKDAFSVGGGYAKMKNGAGNGKDNTVWYGGASYNVGKATLKAQYAVLDSDIKDSGAKMTSIGVDYAIGKDATIYLAYAKTDNDSAASYLANNWGHGKSASGAPAVGKDPSAISLGLVFKFGGSVYKN